MGFDVLNGFSCRTREARGKREWEEGIGSGGWEKKKKPLSKLKSEAKGCRLLLTAPSAA